MILEGRGEADFRLDLSRRVGRAGGGGERWEPALVGSELRGMVQEVCGGDGVGTVSDVREMR